MSRKEGLVDIGMVVNNDHGTPSGKVEAVVVGDLRIQLEGEEPFELVEGGFKIGDVVFAHHGHKSWVGNIYWDNFWMDYETAAALFNYLNRSDCWGIEEAWTTLWNKWEKKTPFVAKDFK